MREPAEINLPFFKRFPFIEYISLYLLLGFILSAACLMFFASIARAVASDGHTLLSVDAALAFELHRMATPTTTALYIFISAFGGIILYVIGVVVALFFVVRRKWMFTVYWLIALVGGVALNHILKTFYARPRPEFEFPLVIETYYSFPSGHSMMSLIIYGILAYFIWLRLRNPYARILVVFGTALLVILIGISRMTLGVHYLTDVVGGYSAAGIWLGLIIMVVNFERTRRLRTSGGKDASP